MMNFEYPMSEKGRTYLRFEHLFLEMKRAMQFDNDSDDTVFFKALFEFLELYERSDCRNDFIKDLQKLSEQLVSWLNYPNVNKVAIQDLIDEIESLIVQTKAAPKQLRYFKGNRFLTSLKQRIAIPSGTCSFDLPHYHFWKHSGQANKCKEAKTWFDQFSVFYQALTIFLKLKRSQGRSEAHVAVNGFSQGTVKDCLFIAVKIENKLSVYPMISGHKNRYSVRFMSANSENKLADKIEFEIISF